jgi:hypothetical protein
MLINTIIPWSSSKDESPAYEYDLPKHKRWSIGLIITICCGILLYCDFIDSPTLSCYRPWPVEVWCCLAKF